MKSTLIIFIIALVIAYFQFSKKDSIILDPKFVKDEIIKLKATYESDTISCKKSSKCLIIYMAPWCGACKQFLGQFYPHLRSLMEEYQKKEFSGLKIIIGMDKKEKIIEMAKGNNIEHFIDDSNKKYQKLLNIKVVPSFIAIDSAGKIVNSMNGLSVQGNTLHEASQNFLKEILKI